MGKLETVFTCQSCGHVERKWSGKCIACGGWSTFVEEQAGERKRAAPAARSRAQRIT